MFAFARSRITVSLTPGKRVAGSALEVGGAWPGALIGATGVSPLFQFASVLQSPLVLLSQRAGTRWSFTYSIPPCATSTSTFAVPLLIPCSLAVLAYCQKCHGSAELG